MKRQFFLFVFAVVAVLTFAKDANAFGKRCQVVQGSGCGGTYVVTNYCYSAPVEYLYTYNVTWCENGERKYGTQVFSTYYGWQKPVANGTVKTTTTPTTEKKTELPDAPKKQAPKYEGLPNTPRYLDLPGNDK